MSERQQVRLSGRVDTQNLVVFEHVVPGLSSRLMALFEKVVIRLGGGALLEEVSHQT